MDSDYPILAVMISCGGLFLFSIATGYLPRLWDHLGNMELPVPSSKLALALALLILVATSFSMKQIKDSPPLFAVVWFVLFLGSFFFLLWFALGSKDGDR